ncbi:MAG TPA: TlpA disulfide reductase family protein [Acidothermaceae bacterium]
MGRTSSTSRTSRLIAGALGAACALGLSACSASSAATSDQQTNYIALNGAGVVTTYAVGHRKVAPQVSGTDLDGKPLTLATYAGKVIVLNFWASWCPPCRSEAPALEQVAVDTRASGVQFVGVDIRENGASDGVNFVNTHHIDYPSFADQSSRIALDFRSTGVQSPPTTIVIDRQGHIAARGLGEMTYSQLLSVVQKVAAEPEATT